MFANKVLFLTQCQFPGLACLFGNLVLAVNAKPLIDKAFTSQGEYFFTPETKNRKNSPQGKSKIVLPEIEDPLHHKA